MHIGTCLHWCSQYEHCILGRQNVCYLENSAAQQSFQVAVSCVGRPTQKVLRNAFLVSLQISASAKSLYSKLTDVAVFILLMHAAATFFSLARMFKTSNFERLELHAQIRLILTWKGLSMVSLSCIVKGMVVQLSA